MHARRLSPLLLAMVVAASCAGGPEVEPQRDVGRPSSSVEWIPCGGAECATLPVPLDHSDPQGTRIDLAVARRPATGDRIGVLAVNPGGPGASGIDALDHLPLPPELSERFDVVTWDPRGVGASTAVECQPTLTAFDQLDPDPDGAAEQAALAEAASAVVEGCQAASGPLLGHLGTGDHAADLEALRRALGERQISYVGYSYGTRLGLEYLAAHPRHVRAMVLDGVVDPTLTLGELLLDQAVALESAIDRGLARCRRDGCAADDPRALLERVGAAVEQDGIAAADGTRAGGDDLAFALTRAGYTPAGVERLVEALAAADAGDGTALVEQADAYRRLADRDAYTAISCVDGPHPVGTRRWRRFAQRLTDAAPTVGAAVANELLPCANWPVSARPGLSPEAYDLGPAVLLLANTGDPATPPRWARAVASRFDDVELIEVEAEGHSVLAGGDGCARSAATGTLISVDGNGPSPSCP